MKPPDLPSARMTATLICSLADSACCKRKDLLLSKRWDQKSAAPLRCINQRSFNGSPCLWTSRPIKKHSLRTSVPIWMQVASNRHCCPYKIQLFDMLICIMSETSNRQTRKPSVISKPLKEEESKLGVPRRQENEITERNERNID